MKPPVVIVTGAARGIGKATALLLAAQHHQLILSGRDASALAETARAVEEAGGAAHPVAGDVRSPETARALVGAAQAHFGRIDAVVNAAGIAKNLPLLELDLETWNNLFALHATATFLCCQAAAKAMVQQGEGGSLVNLSSIAASMAMFTTGAYGAAKAAVSSLTRTFAVELSQHRIRANAVGAGPGAPAPVGHAYGPADYADRGRSIPMNRLAEPEEVAQLIAFLLGDDARYITGQVLTLDGGASAVGAYSYDTYKRNAPTSAGGT
jgi:NAD(P)-dependent dehydrogenase (short-subunit alcohol dehydrogenase family)